MMVQDAEEKTLKHSMKKVFFSVLWGVIVCGLFFSVFILQFIIQKPILPQLIGSNLFVFCVFLFAIFFIMTFSFYLILISNREALKWKIPAKISLVLLAFTIVISVSFISLGVIGLILSPRGGESLSVGVDIFTLAYDVVFMRTGLPVFHISIASMILVFFSSLFVFFFSEKRLLVFGVSVLVMSLLTETYIFFVLDDGCLPGMTECFVQKALSSGNNQFCERTDNSQYCYLRLAVKKNNERLCELTQSENNPQNTNDYYWDDCHMLIGVNRKDPTMCKLARSNSSRANCCNSILLATNYTAYKMAYHNGLPDEIKEKCGVS